MKQTQLRVRWLLGICLIASLLVISACVPSAAPVAEPAEPAAEEVVEEETTEEGAEVEVVEEAAGSEAAEEEIELEEVVGEEAAEEEVAEAGEAVVEEDVVEEGAAAPEIGQIVAEGFNSPQGIFVAEDGSFWVVDAGVGGDEEIDVAGGPEGAMTANVGQTSRLVQIGPDGTQTEVAAFPSLLMGQEASGASRVILVDGIPYVTVGGFIGAPEDERPPLFGAVARVEDGEVVEVADTWAFEAANNPDGFVYESHPYDITTDQEGNLLVAEAGANDLLRIDPTTGEIELVTVFPGVPGLPFPNPNRGGAQELDPVPTGVVVAEDGTIYVSYLPGFPPIPGGKVVTVDPESGEVSDFATNVNLLTDLKMGPDGELYAVHMADFGEQGPMPNSGSIVRIREGDASEQIIGGLSFPTSIGFDAEGNAYITINGLGAPGTGSVLMVEELTAMEGEPLPAPAGPPGG